LEIRVIIANVENWHIFYIIGYGMDVSGFVARFHVGAGIYFLFRAPRETVRPFQPPVQEMCESLGLDAKRQECQIYHSPRSTVEHKKEYYLIQHKIVCLCNGDKMSSTEVRNECLCII
jgi:hypothetical protein